MDSRSDVADRYRRLAKELTSAAAHANRAGEHMDNADSARAAAHAFASEGHLRIAGRVLEELAVLHATKSTLS